MAAKVIIEKPAELYEEVGKLITAHYTYLKRTGGFGKEYPVIYGLYLEIAARGLRRQDKSV